MEVTEKYGHWINSVIIGELSRSSLRFHGGHWESGAKCIIPHGYGVFFFSYVEPGGNSMLADGYSRLFHMWGFFLNFFMWGLVALYSDCQPQIVSGNFEPYLVPFW